MKDEYLRILKSSLKDEVDVYQEWRRLSSQIGKEKGISQNNKENSHFSLRIFKYAAAVCLGILLASAASLLVEKSPEQVIAGNYKVRTDKGEKSYVELPDGTKVWLNTCTTLEYSSDYGINNRDINLNGEAYFEVAKNKELPFIVKTNGVNVKALGTAFNISAYSDDTELVTTLYSGQVAVQPTLTKQEVLLNPNQMAVYYKDRHRIETMAAGEKGGLQWREGILVFDMMHLDEITKLLERNYNVVFRYENQRIKKLQFSGTFKNTESINDILKVVTTNTRIGFRMEKDTIVFE